MFCHNCGEELVDEAIFCTNCGAKQVTDEEILEPETRTEELKSEDEKQPDLSAGKQQALHTDEANTAAGKSAADTSINSFHKSIADKFKNVPQKTIFKILGVVVVIAVAFLLFGGQNIIASTKGLVFDEYGTISIGDAADRYLEDVKWESEKITDNEYKVTLRAFSSELSYPFEMEFRIACKDDMIYGRPQAVSIAGERYTDDMSIWMMLSIIYGMSAEEAEAAYWGAFWGGY